MGIGFCLGPGKIRRIFQGKDRKQPQLKIHKIQKTRNQKFRIYEPKERAVFSDRCLQRISAHKSKIQDL
jgi:hypothetical protein